MHQSSCDVTVPLRERERAVEAWYTEWPGWPGCGGLDRPQCDYSAVHLLLYTGYWTCCTRTRDGGAA
eukprot:6475165-Prymnesium_polylepis.1